ncbi:MAG: hypothetical protein AAGA54_03700 [Myxococcota bacterium]
MGRSWLVVSVMGCVACTSSNEPAAEATSGDMTAATSSGDAAESAEDGSTSAEATVTGGRPDDGTSSAGDVTGADDGSSDEGAESSSGGPEVEPFHTCGEGGPFGDWATREVAYPAGTMLEDGTPVTTARYDIWAPDPVGGPYPLVVALHGDNGNPGATKSDWTHLLDLEAFILVTPQEPHQEVDGGLPGNGWDNHPDQTRGFLSAIFDDVGANYDVDIDRVYATGASAGSWVGGQIFFTMQDTLAAVQFSCGGATGVGYAEPSDAACKTPARFEIAPSDFLYDAAQATATFITERGHEVEFNDTACEGHCCGQKEDYGDAAWAFFETRLHCGAPSRSGCGDIPTP